MVDHLHLIVAHHDVSGFMRDFKTWTSRQISATLEEEGKLEALQAIHRAALALGDRQASVWQAGFHPKGIVSDAMMLQKLQYLHHNPVRKGFVPVPEAWWYSSASDYLLGKQGPVAIDAVAPLIA
ncbi:transposase [Verrucomicrobiota bacterium sgz303538]